MCHPNQRGQQYHPPSFHRVGKMIQVAVRTLWHGVPSRGPIVSPFPPEML